MNQFRRAVELSMYNHTSMCSRLLEILLEAPWAVFDLLAGILLVATGAYIGLAPYDIISYSPLYWALTHIAAPYIWGTIYALCGVFSIVVALLPVKPCFEFRLLARCGVAGSFLSLFIDFLTTLTFTFSACLFLPLSIFSFWAVWRTSRCG